MTLFVMHLKFKICGLVLVCRCRYQSFKLCPKGYNDSILQEITLILKDGKRILPTRFM